MAHTEAGWAEGGGERPCPVRMDDLGAVIGGLRYFHDRSWDTVSTHGALPIVDRLYVGLCWSTSTFAMSKGFIPHDPRSCIR